MGSTSRVVSLVIALVIGVVLGHVLWPPKPKEAPQFQQGFAGANAVYIGPEAKDVNPAMLVIAVEDDPVVYWKPWLPNQGYTLGITFDSKDYPAKSKGEPPFEKGQNGKPQQIPCPNGTCFSYHLNKNVVALFNDSNDLPCPPDMPPPPPGHKPYTQCLDYKYSQTLNGTTEDGRIIIVKP